LIDENDYSVSEYKPDDEDILLEQAIKKDPKRIDYLISKIKDQIFSN